MVMDILAPLRLSFQKKRPIIGNPRPGVKLEAEPSAIPSADDQRVMTVTVSPPPTAPRSDRETLLGLLFERAFQAHTEPVFRLASGAMSRVYLNCKLVTLDPRGATLIGRLMFERLRGFGIKGVGGLTLGADPIALATAVASDAAGEPIPAFIVRKEPKGHGTEQWIEGPLEKGAPVAVVDDVVTTGGSTEKALEILSRLGHPIWKVVALVDRDEGGREAIRRRGFELESLYRIDEFMALWNAGRSGAVL
jgi:orotate phosphoribosyltransferase